MDKWLWMLSGKRVMTRGEGDCNVVKSRNGSVQADFLAWKMKFLKRLQALAKGEKKICNGNCKGEGKCKNKRKAKEEENAALQNNSSEVRTEIKHSTRVVFMAHLDILIFHFFIVKTSISVNYTSKS